MKTKDFIISLILLLSLGLVLGTVIHEFVGHGLTTYAFGGNVTRYKASIISYQNNILRLNPFYIGGGIDSGWYEYNNRSLDWGDYNPFAFGFIAIMAPVVALLISLTASIIILAKKPKGWTRLILIIFSLYFIDPLSNFFTSDFYRPTGLIGFLNTFPFYVISVLVAIIGSSTIYMAVKERYKKEKILIKYIKWLYGVIFVYLIYFGCSIYLIYYM